MMHNVRDLFKINGAKFYTYEYIEKNGIPKANRYDESGWEVARYFNPSKAKVLLHTSNGVREIFIYGEKTWFDTEEERDAYRAEKSAERAKLIARNKVLRAVNEKIAEKLNGMTEQELTDLLARL